MYFNQYVRSIVTDGQGSTHGFGTLYTLLQAVHIGTFTLYVLNTAQMMLFN